MCTAVVAWRRTTARALQGWSFAVQEGRAMRAQRETVLQASSATDGEFRKKPPAAHGRRSLFGSAAALRPPEPTAPVHTCPVGPQTSSGIVIARFGRSQDLSVASRGAGEAPRPAGPAFEPPRRRDATDWHGKARRARHGRSASRAARATPSVACSSGLSRPPCCLDRALDPVDRPARRSGGWRLHQCPLGASGRRGARAACF